MGISDFNPLETDEQTRTHALEAASFDDAILDHMVRCWDAACENAERINKKVSLMVSVLAVLFGVGLFKIDWTYDPHQLANINPPCVLWSVKIALILALLCFGVGLYIAASRTKRAKGSPELAGDLLFLPDEVIQSPPASEKASRALVFFAYSKALDEIRRQNEKKIEQIKRCRWWFFAGILIVFLVLVTYTLCSYPPIREASDGRTNATQPANIPARP